MIFCDHFCVSIFFRVQSLTRKKVILETIWVKKRHRRPSIQNRDLEAICTKTETKMLKRNLLPALHHRLANGMVSLSFQLQHWIVPWVNTLSMCMSSNSCSRRRSTTMTARTTTTATTLHPNGNVLSSPRPQPDAQNDSQGRKGANERLVVAGYLSREFDLDIQYPHRRRWKGGSRAASSR